MAPRNTNRTFPRNTNRAFGRVGHGVREDRVRTQYADPTDARSYVTAHEGWGSTARYFHSRIHVMDEALRQCKGDLLDAGCGPGMLVRHLLETRPGDFRITASDRSPAMVEVVAEQTRGLGDIRTSVANVEDMPFPDASFDVVTATGVLDYVDAGRALREFARIVRPGGLVAVAMLNPVSPYRLVQWVIHWPVVRLLGRVERLLGVPANRRHGVAKTGIRALTPARTRRQLREAGLHVEDVVFYDITYWLPPLDKVGRRWNRRWRSHPDTTVSRGWRRWLGTGYLMTARRRDATTDK